MPVCRCLDADRDKIEIPKYLPNVILQLKSGFIKVDGKTFIYHVDFMGYVFFLDLNAFYEYFATVKEKQFQRYIRMAEKVFVTGNNMAVFECPQCNKAKRVDVSRYKDIRQVVRIKVKCSCGHSYRVVLERRKHFRKGVNFSGTYTKVLPDYREDKGGMTVKDLWGMTVKDLSRAGVKIKLNVKKDFKVGDILSVEFSLDDKRRSLIKKEAVIKKISDLYLGVEFSSVDSSNPSDKAIGFYMFT